MSITFHNIFFMQQEHNRILKTTVNRHRSSIRLHLPVLASIVTVISAAGDNKFDIQDTSKAISEDKISAWKGSKWQDEDHENKTCFKISAKQKTLSLAGHMVPMSEILAQLTMFADFTYMGREVVVNPKSGIEEHGLYTITYESLSPEDAAARGDAMLKQAKAMKAQQKKDEAAKKRREKAEEGLLAYLVLQISVLRKTKPPKDLIVMSRQPGPSLMLPNNARSATSASANGALPDPSHPLVASNTPIQDHLAASYMTDYQDLDNSDHAAMNEIFAQAAERYWRIAYYRWTPDEPKIPQNADAQNYTISPYDRYSPWKPPGWHWSMATSEEYARACRFMSCVPELHPGDDPPEVPGIPQDFAWNFEDDTVPLRPYHVWWFRCLKPGPRYHEYLNFDHNLRVMRRFGKESWYFWNAWFALIERSKVLIAEEHAFYSRFAVRDDDTPLQEAGRQMTWYNVLVVQAQGVSVRGDSQEASVVANFVRAPKRRADSEQSSIDSQGLAREFPSNQPLYMSNIPRPVKRMRKEKQHPVTDDNGSNEVAMFETTNPVADEHHIAPEHAQVGSIPSNPSPRVHNTIEANQSAAKEISREAGNARYPSHTKTNPTSTPSFPTSSPSIEEVPYWKLKYPGDKVDLPDGHPSSMSPEGYRINELGTFDCFHTEASCAFRQCKGKTHRCCREGYAYQEFKTYLSKLRSKWRKKVMDLHEQGALDRRHIMWPVRKWAGGEMAQNLGSHDNAPAGEEVKKITKKKKKKKKEKKKKKKKKEKKKKKQEIANSPSPSPPLITTDKQQDTTSAPVADSAPATASPSPSTSLPSSPPLPSQPSSFIAAPLNPHVPNMFETREEAYDRKIQNFRAKYMATRDRPNLAYFDAFWDAKRAQELRLPMTVEMNKWLKMPGPFTVGDLALPVVQVKGADELDKGGEKVYAAGDSEGEGFDDLFEESPGAVEQGEIPVDEHHGLDELFNDPDEP
ncbi:hypothetical protein ACEQ8H_007632 [Pleosporales sp. CAS-2024a]